MKNDIHEVTFPCDYWRKCCCSTANDGHCWGCGCERSGHKDGEGFCKREGGDYHDAAQPLGSIGAEVVS